MDISSIILNFVINIGIILMLFLALSFLDLVFKICAMVSVVKDAKKRGIEIFWYWPILIFFFGFIAVIIYMAINKDNPTQTKEFIDTRINENIAPNPTYIKMPKYLIFYIIFSIFYIFSSFFIIVSTFTTTISIIKYAVDNENVKYELDVIDKNLDNIDKFIEDIEYQAYTIYNSVIDKIHNSSIEAKDNIATFTSREMPKSITENMQNYLNNPSNNTLSSYLKSLTDYFKDNLVTYEFQYPNKSTGILKIKSHMGNFSNSEMKRFKKLAKNSFFGQDLKSILIISQNVDGTNLLDIVDFDFYTPEKTKSLDKSNFVKGYPIYISFYSNISSKDYKVDVSLE